MDYGALTAARLRSGQWLHWGIRFFLAAALTASETVDGYAPFALGCIAAAGPGAGGAAALGGGVMGALLFLPFQQALAFAAVGILTVTAATAFRDTDFFKRPWVMPVLAAGMVLAVGGIYACQALDPVSSIVPARRQVCSPVCPPTFLPGFFRVRRTASPRRDCCFSARR